MNQTPLVSICIPTYNGSTWVLDALRSTLTQRYSSIEVVVVDDASTDDTVAKVASVQDPRIRIEKNKCNLGLVGNWNRCIRLAHGDFIKFLFQDDILYPDCCNRMVRMLEDQPRLGMVFARRDILLEDPDDLGAIAWKKRYAILDDRFEQLDEFNDGRRLFDDYLKKRFVANFVGEPTSVMVRKECFARLGLFNTRMYQTVDIEMWLRIMYFYDVGFIREPLSAFRVHERSMSGANGRSGRAWLDQLWLLEGLSQYREIRRSHPLISWMKFVDAMYIMRWELHRLIYGPRRQVRKRLPDLVSYMSFYLRRLLGCAPTLHGEATDGRG